MNPGYDIASGYLCITLLFACQKYFFSPWFFCLSQIILIVQILMAQWSVFFFFPLQYLMTFFRGFLSIISSCMNFYFCSTYPLDLNSLLSLLHHVISLLRTHHSLPIAFKIKSKFLPQPTKATHDLAFLSFAITYTLFYMTQTSCTHLLKWPSLDLCVWVLLVFLTFSER